jgi:O-methyltransferase domain
VFREVTPCTFVNSEASRLFREAPGGLRNYALFATSEQYLKSCAELGRSLQTGLAAHDHAHGQSVWEYMRDHPEDNAAFNRGLAEIRKDEQAAIAAAYDWTAVTSIVDIGAGAGSLVASIVAGNPGVRGILFDRPDVLPDADSRLTARGVRERCDLVEGSLFESIPVQGNVSILSQVLHDWPDAECRTILMRCRERMRSADRLLVVEMVPVPGQPDIGVALLDMTMMTFGGEARQRTEEEYNELFAATGFSSARVVGTGTAFSILEVRPG